MKPIKGTKTEINLLTAFAGESQARNRYDYFASIAKKDGYEQITHIFQETALQEKEHAKRLFKYLTEGHELTISAGFPAGKMGSTLENLYASAQGEQHEHEIMYPEFAVVAAEEGLNDIASTFKAIAVAEAFHEERFRAFIANIEKGVVFSRPGQEIVWRCRNCGYIHHGSEAPDLCPACVHPRAHFEIACKNW